MRAKRGTAILIAPPARVAISMTSSAGSFQASENHGKTPSDTHPVCSVMAAMPSSKSDTSPRNLLIVNPLILLRSLAGKTACVPTICAITPPRSISPIRTTGTLAASANPIFAISPERRLISAGLPAPSITMKSACFASPTKESNTRGIKVGLSAT